MDFTLTVDDLNVGTLLLRLAGLMFAAHGAQKLFGWFGGMGMEGAVSLTTGLGMWRPKEQAYIAGVNEFAGGLLLALGLLTALGAAMVVATMVVAIGTVSGKNGFFIADRGYEYNLLLIVVAVAIVCVSPGEWSLDNALGLDLVGATWGLVALAAGVAGGGAVLATRTAAER